MKVQRLSRRGVHYDNLSSGKRWYNYCYYLSVKNLDNISMITGIYCIKNLVNNKIYIGSSYDVNRRLTDHKYLLLNNKHHSIHLQRSYNKHGLNNFSFDILEECTVEDLLVREQYYLDTLLKANEYKGRASDYFINYGYNICSSSIKGFTGKQSRESILKQVRTRGFSTIYKVDTNGKILDIYDIKADIDEGINAIHTSIKTRSTIFDKDYGYIESKDWYEDYKPQIKIRTVWNKGLKTPTDKGKKVYVYDIYGRYYNTFNTILSCSNHFKSTSSSILKKIDKINSSLIGNTIILKYTFFRNPIIFDRLIRVSNIGNIEVYTIFNEKIGNSNVEELCNLLKVKPQSIKNTLSGYRRQIKGYILK